MTLQQKLDTLKHLDEHKRAFWSARALCSLLGFKEWWRFKKRVDRLNDIYYSLGIDTSEHYRKVEELNTSKQSVILYIKDYSLSSKACFELVSSLNTNKPGVLEMLKYFESTLNEQSEKWMRST